VLSPAKVRPGFSGQIAYLFVKLPSNTKAHDEVRRFDVVRVQGSAQDGRRLKL
jgi:hypothetical protein